MKKLKLADSTTIEVDDISTLNDIAVTTTADKVAGILKAITPENLKAAKLGDDNAKEVIFENGTFSVDGDAITMHFISRYPTDEELLQRRINDLEDVVASLTE